MPMNSPEFAMISRRRLLELTGLGFGSIALAGLLQADESERVYNDILPRKGHHAGSAQAVIQLVMNGGPSQMDLFDYKPALIKYSGQPHPDGVEIHQPNNANVLMPGAFPFKPYGQCGMEMAGDVMPQVAPLADDLCLVRSMYSEHNNHPEGLNQLLSCRIFPGRPVMGSWISYALGTVNQNLPAYIVLRDPEGYPTSGKQLWSSGWLPALYQGVEFNTTGVPVHNLSRLEPLPPGAQRESLDLLAKLNAAHAKDHPGESELESRIRNYELAARMQPAAAEVLDLTKETDATRKLYGLDNPATTLYGTRCLMARRLIESGVRFVQVFSGPGQPWDHHNKIKELLPQISSRTDQPVAALLKDLKSRGLLDRTIVMWAGEFGRLPTTQNGDGRDHNRNAFSLWLAGGGFKGGLSYGATDEFGYKSVVDRVSVPSLQATMLYALGIDHLRLTYSHEGREQTPTDASVTGAQLVPGLLKNPPAA